LSWTDAAKRVAAAKALEEFPTAGVVGIGSGTTMELFVHELAKNMSGRSLDVKLVPTSSQIEAVIVSLGLVPTGIDAVSQVDLAFDGADQVEQRSLDLIKGGGAALTREKIVDSAADRVIVMVDERKLAPQLGGGQPVPLEVLPLARGLVMSRLRALGAIPTLRLDAAKTAPVVTDNDNYIVDAAFGPIKHSQDLECQLKSIPGLVETGLFLGMTDRVYVGRKDGTVQVLDAD
jgi:ribose 5-phosphate isomerase A